MAVITERPALKAFISGTNQQNHAVYEQRYPCSWIKQFEILIFSKLQEFERAVHEKIFLI
jgi:hypothetical protein